MNIKILKMAVAGVVLLVSGFSNAGLIISDVSYSANSVTFKINGDLSGYTPPASSWDVAAFGIKYSGDIWAGSDYAPNTWSTTVFDNVTINNSGNTGQWTSSTPYSWSHYSAPFTNATTATNRLVTLTIGANYLNTSSTNGGIEFVWGWGNSQHEQYEVVLGSFSTFSDANAVPEPSTLAIFALSIIGLASRRFKKQ